ncbi:MAG: DNA polymerase I [Planctomycetota bacterium]|nr:DNA polymerase I [Planctomycetota bacterium]
MSKTLYAIDVFSLVFQVYHAIPPMTGTSGQPTNAVFGFTRDLLTILRLRKPDYMICAMDLPGRGVREDIYQEYKANRDEMPEDLRPQIPLIVEVIKGFGIPVIGLEGWEADDVLATLARRGEAEGIQVNIVTSDKDARQLLSPLVRLYNVRKDTFLDEADLIADWGVRADQVVDFQALVGDKVDNVPGVPLIGPKKASALLNQFGTLEDVLAHADDAPGQKLQENLKTYADQARVSRRLVELNTQLDFELNWNAALAGQLNVARLTDLFRDCGFRKFINEIRDFAPEGSIVEPDPLFAEDDPVVEIITDEVNLQLLAERIAAAESVTLRPEFDGLDPFSSTVLSLTVATDERSASFVPLHELVSEQSLDPAVVWKTLAPVLTAGETTISGHDVKATLTSLRRAADMSGCGASLERAEPGLDTMVGNYLLSAGSRNHSLSQLVERYFGLPIEPLSRQLSSDSNERAPFTVAELAKCSAEEACLMFRTCVKMREELEENNLWDLYHDLERPLISVLVDLEHTGVRVDPDELNRQNDEVSASIESLIAEIHAAAGESFNVDSPKQLSAILFEKLGLPILKKTKTGASTDQEVLEQLAALHDLPKKIIENRHLVKLKGTYLDTLPKLINLETGRIHASFNQVVAATGRLSSSNPNLQNIPIRTPEGERIRRAFVPGEPGWKFVCADYSQIELRVLAHLSGDVAMQRAFADGIDIHRAVASEVFGVSPEDVDSSQRRMAKGVNFGVIYGQSSFGLSTALGISREEATAFIDSYFERYCGVAAFMETTLDECRETGFATTILGRRRAISGIRPSRHGQLNMPERTAVNTVIQGSAADLIKTAMINIHRTLKAEQHPARMLLQIHDELVFETPESEAESLVTLVRTGMETAFTLDVPLTVDIAIGDNWLDAKS